MVATKPLMPTLALSSPSPRPSLQYVILAFEWNKHQTNNPSLAKRLAPALRLPFMSKSFKSHPPACRDSPTSHAPHVSKLCSTSHVLNHQKPLNRNSSKSVKSIHDTQT